MLRSCAARAPQARSLPLAPAQCLPPVFLPAPAFLLEWTIARSTAHCRVELITPGPHRSPLRQSRRLAAPDIPATNSFDPLSHIHSMRASFYLYANVGFTHLDFDFLLCGI